ncbi:response regulator [Vibrio fluvialis]|uniref:ATP-binding response regulator n=1 Tax=Vibrio fluvialis TaxID=676 RepID=UPI00192C3748|nr:hybrid sensor histidine kinase/response regulator [Vibrio fluvialis]MBL4295765.1 response regulator [Vibrio fluvialis]WDY54022.1 response regulator [Vibrio fluvialis]
MEVVKKIYQYAEPNLTLVGWMGFIGFPLYYYIWQYVFPQPYESLLLRSFCSCLFGGIAFRNSVPKLWQRYLPYYYLFMIGFCLPFFFAYMMLMNDWSTVWAMSFMASIFLHILLVHETKVMLLQAAISILAAYGTVYWIQHYEPQQYILWPYVPIFLFTYVFGNLFYFRNQSSHESKVSIAKSFGAGIAHEMRNPLSALKSSVDVLRSILPAQSNISRGAHIDEQDLTLLHEILDNADEVIHTGNETIDLLLTSIDENRVSRSTFRKQSAREVVDYALHSFSYKRAIDRQSVTLVVEDDFDYFGSDTLLKFALYNLLKNAFYYQNSEQFHIDVTLKTQGNQNLIVVKDNGVGIAPDRIDDIFKDFYTFGKNGSYGLGLPFCRKVMKSFGGNIACASVLGEWTEFTLSFPLYESQEVSHIKLDLMKNKSVLYIGTQGLMSRHLSETSFYQGFRLHLVTLQEALVREEYEFEYDAIVLDLEQIEDHWQSVVELESKLHFTEAQIVYLFDKQREYPINIERHLRVTPLDIRQMLRDTDKELDKLFFDAAELVPDRNVIPQKKQTYERRILVVDDNQSLRTFTALMLEKQGYEVVQANDGQQALDAVESSDFDLILMDIEMPFIDGIEATRVIRDSDKPYRHIPIVGHTGDNSPMTIEKIHKSGMNDYIVKPADKDKLLGKLANWI